MALQDKTGIEKLVWNVSSPITLDGAKIAPEDAMEIRRILQVSAKGTSSRTGNKIIDHEFAYRDKSVAALVDAEDGNLADLEIWQLGSVAVDETISNVCINVVSDNVNFDPTAEETSPVMLRIYRVWNG